MLGEQSAKSLRGDAMMDVIFNGSGGRKPAGMAEVVLVFENPKPPEDGTRALNLDVDEVAVGRRLFRDGTSEYQINNGSSRLKDIRELFLDTGVGVDAYSVIEQGRVVGLLESQPRGTPADLRRGGRHQQVQGTQERSAAQARKSRSEPAPRERHRRGSRKAATQREDPGRTRPHVIRNIRTRLRELRLTYALQEYHTHHTQVGQLTGEQRRCAVPPG